MTPRSTWMWATADESRADVVGLYRRAWAHADATIDALALDSTGYVRHWREGRRNVTLHRILSHMVAETQRHAGHADIVRELIDEPPGCIGRTRTWRSATRPGGRSTGSGWRTRRGRRPGGTTP
jgi:uncharacterized protein DUF664